MAENQKISSITKNDNAEAPKPDASVEAAKEVGADEVQARFDEAEEKGFFGPTIDKTPRENYTLQGVGSGAETPETDGSRIVHVDAEV